MSVKPETLVQDKVIEWLLEKNEPSVHYYALTELLGRDADDQDVRLAR